MYEFDEKTMGMYKYGIKGYPISEQVRGIDIKPTRRDREGNLQITVETLDYKRISLETDGRGTVGDIIDQICEAVRGR